MSVQLPTCQHLILKRTDWRLYVTLNRPKSRNALSDGMMEELFSVMASVRDERSIRTLIMRGAGGTFCAGGDIKGFKRMFHATEAPTPTREQIAANNRTFGDLLIQLNELPQTVVMLVEGAAIGGGMGLLCVSDVAIATANAKFSLSETRLGLPAAQIAPFVVQRIGITEARRLMLTGARFNGEEARRLGLVHFVAQDRCEMEEVTNRVLKGINRCAPGANATTKEILFASQRMALTDTLDRASQHFADCIQSDEGREGVAAFLQKRRARWVESLD